MSTKPLGPPPIIPDDPGPWSVVSMVFAQAGRPGRRRPQPPMGLMLSPAPDLGGLEPAGLDEASPVAGVGRVVVAAAAREPAFALAFDGDGVLRGVSPYVARSWAVPGLTLSSEERPPEDPAAGLPEPVPPPDVTGSAPIAVAPGGVATAHHTREGRHDVIAVVAGGAIVRWVRGARAAAWSPEGTWFALGGPWGVLLTRGREAA
jgi:hypothetical protein